ncbi:DUF2852 domain-containing protein [Chelatococcus sambhunathii]|uniref:DUF2852 domain-containing protein n=1 Tax=Chelatococcus sambhunathii TaxID=363953 RepID=A0ABU1DKQ9_9HYPH|nr:DUF2852 domain-containing protein [Chelatococcus sambhunathii]MDR4308726.1 DUF2852 domain-containing protein [Chelatococcus sambhunathii]
MTSNPPFDDAASAIPGVPHRWNALTIALTVIGFIVFWPLGLAMILYVLCGEQIMAAKRSPDGPLSQARKAAEEFGRKVRDEFRPQGATMAGGFGASRRTGNAAFDAWREAELKRLDEERRKLDETTAAFEAHLRAERGAYDESRQREEFDRFMSGRHG